MSDIETCVVATVPGEHTLPGLVRRAAASLSSATGAAEVLEARDMARVAYDAAKSAARFCRAKSAHDDVIAAVYRAQADSLEIEAMAKRRLADEYDGAQERGEVRGQGNIPSENVSTLADIGLTGRDVFEARQIRDAEQAEPGIVRRTLDALLEAGEEPTKAAVNREIVAVGEREIMEAAKRIRASRADNSRSERIDRIESISLGNAELDTSRRYPIIYADPPWRYEMPAMGGSNRSIENHYPTMALDDICALPVAEIAADDALLYLWATAPKLPECLKVIEAWGFEYRTHIVWVKDKIGMGYHARSQHELLLIAKRGEMPPPRPGEQPSSVIHAPRGGHSEKPAIFAETIERLYPEVGKIELFCRSPREGWSVWGNQSGGEHEDS